MRLEEIFLGLTMFLVMVAGSTQVHVDMNQANGVNNNQTTDLTREYDEMQATVYGDDLEPGSHGGCSKNSSQCGLYEQVKTLSHPTQDIFQTLSAGLFVIPSLMNFLIQPINMFYGAVDTLHAALPWIPTWAIGGIKLIFTIGLVFGLIAAVLRWKP